ncbi:MAG: TetR/AcrR family transcriptional regulator [Nocardioides sp.]
MTATVDPPAAVTAPDAPLGRPRIEGEREQEIFAAALRVLADVGYDRLTMDAVATAARASKATLYRRWNGKVSLVVDALKSTTGTAVVPDTGNLRDDLIAAYCCPGGVTDPRTVDILASVMTAVTRDPEFAAAFRTEVIGPKIAASSAVFAQAQKRGAIRPDVDLEFIGPALAGIVLHRHYILGDCPDATMVARVIDEIILPAVRPYGVGGPVVPSGEREK